MSVEQRHPSTSLRGADRSGRNEYNSHDNLEKNSPASSGSIYVSDGSDHDEDKDRDKDKDHDKDEDIDNDNDKDQDPDRGDMTARKQDASWCFAIYPEVFAQNTNFLLFFLAQLISNVGDQLYTVGMTVAVYQSTHSALHTLAGFLAGRIPSILLGPVAGVIADHFPRKIVCVYMDAVRVVCCLLLLLSLTFLSRTPSFYTHRALFHGSRYVCVCMYTGDLYLP